MIWALEPLVHYKPVHLHSYFRKNYNFHYEEFPISNDFYQNVISLPIYPLLDKKSINHILDSVIRIWDDYKK